MTRLASDIWNSFCRVQGIWLAIGSIVFSAILVFYGPDLKITIDQKGLVAFYLLGLVSFVCFMTVLDMLVCSRTQHRGFPRVFHVIDPHIGTERAGQNLSLLVEKSEWFSFDSVVSIYHSDFFDSTPERYEKYVGFGRVQTVQQDGKVQVVILNVEQDRVELLERLKKNDPATLRTLLVKPAIPWEALEKQLK